MIKELDLVVITHDINDYCLKAGDIGTVVYCYEDESAFEVEFLTTDGETIAVLTLTREDIRLFENKEILCVRDFEQLVA